MPLSPEQVSALLEFFAAESFPVSTPSVTFPTPVSKGNLFLEQILSRQLDPVSGTQASLVSLRRSLPKDIGVLPQTFGEVVENLGKRSLFFEPAANPTGGSKGLAREFERAVGDRLPTQGIFDRSVKERVRLFETALGREAVPLGKTGIFRMAPKGLPMLLLLILSAVAAGGAMEES